ncbi:MAG: beta-propeller domain-containing protein [Thermoproteota archaeon]
MRSRLSALLTLTVMASIMLGALMINIRPVSKIGLSTFNSYDELKNFVETRLTLDSLKNIWQYLVPPYDVLGRVEKSAGDFAYFSTEGEYSTTNIQVLGVDEANLVKTDGKNIYLISSNKIFIVEAYLPACMRVISRIVLDGLPIGLFISSSKIAVLTYEAFPIDGFDEKNRDFYWLWGVALKIYDASDIENPVLVRSIVMEGSYVSSRMIGKYIYIVTSQSAFRYFNQSPEAIFPRIFIDGVEERIPLVRFIIRMRWICRRAILL